jgi:hypothetical protein
MTSYPAAVVLVALPGSWSRKISMATLAWAFKTARAGASSVAPLVVIEELVEKSLNAEFERGTAPMDQAKEKVRLARVDRWSGRVGVLRATLGYECTRLGLDAHCHVEEKEVELFVI